MHKDFFAEFRPEFQDAIEHLKGELSSLRTGRANPSMLDNVMVEAYGSKQPIVGLASISTPDARTILIEPWDKSILKDIERGIQEAKLNLNPVIQGQGIRLSLPALTEDGRKALIKIMNEKLEQARVGFRTAREKVRAEVIRAEKAKEISEDEKYRFLEQLDKNVAGFNEQVKQIGAEKEKEIMTI